MSAESVTVQPATLGDLPAIEALDRCLFGAHGYPYMVLRQLYDLARPGLLVATTASETLCGYTLLARAHASDEGWLMALGVDAAFRRQGVGRQLTNAAQTAAVGVGLRRLLLTVHPANTSARDLYASVGFQVIEESKDYFGPGEPRLVMQTRLPD